MFCHQCGSRERDGGRFCDLCGAALSSAPGAGSAPSSLVGEEPALVLRPRFVASTAIVRSLPLALFFALWGGGFFGGFCTFVVQAIGADVPPWSPFLICGSLALVGIPLVYFQFLKRSYARTEYRFFPHKLEYFEGFFGVEEKSLSLSAVREVHLKKGVLQERHGIGTVVLATSSETDARRGGLRLVDVEDPDRVYAAVKELLDRCARPAHRLAA